MEESILSPTPAPAPAVAPAAEPTPSSEPPAQATPQNTPPPSFLGEGMAMNFEGLASLMEPEHRGAIDGLKDRFDGKPITEFVNSYRELEKNHTELSQRSSAPAEATLEAYGITKPEGIADDVWNKESAKTQEFIKDAHEAGVTKAGFQKLYSRYIASETAAQEQAATAQREAITTAQKELSNEWGTEYGAKLETTNNSFSEALAELGIDRGSSEQVTALENNPVFIRYAHLQAVKLAEAQGKTEGNTTMPNGSTSTQLSGAEQAADIMTNPANPMHTKFMEQSAAGGGDVVDFVQSLRAKQKSAPTHLR